MPAAGMGATWRPRSASTSSACAAAGALAMAAVIVSDLRHNDGGRHDTRRPRPFNRDMRTAGADRGGLDSATVAVGLGAPTPRQVVEVARHGAPVVLAGEALAA